MVHCFGFISIVVSRYDFSVSAKGALNRVAHSFQMFLHLNLSKSFLFILFAFDACLPLSLAYSGLARFQPLAQSHAIGNQNLCHFILLLLISILMKQLTCNVGIISLIPILVWIFSGCDSFWVTRTDVLLTQLCSLHDVCQFVAFEQVKLYFCLLRLFYCIVGITLCRFVSLCLCFWLSLIVLFTSVFSLSCTDLCKVSTQDSGYVISQIAILIAEIEGRYF